MEGSWGVIPVLPNVIQCDFSSFQLPPNAINTTCHRRIPNSPNSPVITRQPHMYKCFLPSASRVSARKFSWSTELLLSACHGHHTSGTRCSKSSLGPGPLPWLLHAGLQGASLSAMLRSTRSSFLAPRRSWRRTLSLETATQSSLGLLGTTAVPTTR